MKKIKYLMLLLAFVFLTSGCTKKQEEVKNQNPSTPLLLEVTKEDQTNKMYLFGSIHAAEDTMYPLPDYVIDAYKNSKILAVEFDLIDFQKDTTAQTELLSKFINPDGKLITDYIEEELYEKAVKIINNVTPYNQLYDYYNPMMFQMLIENATMLDNKLFSNLGIDTYLLELAKKDQKEILELESAEFQYDMLTSFDIKMQTYLLEQSINKYEESKTNLKKLYDLYKKGDKKQLEKLMFTDEEETDEYVKKYNDQLITKRNKNMMKSLKKEFISNKNIFCTVGLAHIIGEDGIASQLEKEGYIIKIIQ